MHGERSPVDSHRLFSLVGKMHDKRYRDNYVVAHTRRVLAQQMRNFRGELPQGEFGELIGKRQTVVSRLENPNYGAWQLRTMFEIASKCNVAVFVRFVDFPTFLKYTNDLSDEALHPESYREEAMDEFVAYETAVNEFFITSGIASSAGVVDVENVNDRTDASVLTNVFNQRNIAMPETGNLRGVQQIAPVGLRSSSIPSVTATGPGFPLVANNPFSIEIDTMASGD
jgi:hypothetical protein